MLRKWVPVNSFCSRKREKDGDDRKGWKDACDLCRWLDLPSTPAMWTKWVLNAWTNEKNPTWEFIKVSGYRQFLQKMEKSGSLASAPASCFVLFSRQGITVQIRLAWNSLVCTRFFLLSAGIQGVHLHAQSFSTCLLTPVSQNRRKQIIHLMEQ